MKQTYDVKDDEVMIVVRDDETGMVKNKAVLPASGLGDTVTVELTGVEEDVADDS